MDQETTLSELLALNLHECEEEVKNIVDKAVKEMSMEKILRDLNTTWSVMEFDSEIHPRTQCRYDSLVFVGILIEIKKIT